MDGAFGLWAAASPATAGLVDGIELADSWACDAHKWLNVPYDSGFVFSAHPATHAAAASYTASYLVGSGARAVALRLRPRIVPPGKGFRRLGGTARARQGRRRRAGGPLLPARPAVRRRAVAQAAWRSSTTSCSTRCWSASARTRHRCDRRGRAAGRHVLARRHHLARPPADAHLGLELVDHRTRRGPFGGRDPAGRTGSHGVSDSWQRTPTESVRLKVSPRQPGRIRSGSGGRPAVHPV